MSIVLFLGIGASCPNPHDVLTFLENEARVALPLKTVHQIEKGQ